MKASDKLCNYSWGTSADYAHECRSEKDHSGPHECHCGETMERPSLALRTERGTKILFCAFLWFCVGMIALAEWYVYVRPKG
jgi:hypothetical protein